MHRSEWMARMMMAQRKTFQLLDIIQQETGYSHKQIIALDIADYKANPAWFDGKIEIGYNNDPESIAHEIGHGLHEKIRETGKPDVLGEKFVDAIRYYVESELNTNSEWFRNFNRGQNPFIIRYNSFQQFVSALRDRSVFNAVGW